MDELRRLEAKQLARVKARSKRRRVSIIRRRTVQGSLATFAVLWAIIFARLVSGNDPALSKVRNSTPAAKQSPSATAPPSQPEESEPSVEFAPEAEPEATELEAEVEETPPEFEEAEVAEPEVEVAEPEVEPEPIITGSS